MKGAYEHVLRNAGHRLVEHGTALLRWLDEPSDDTCESLSDWKLMEIRELAVILRLICYAILDSVDGIGYLRETDGNDSES